MTATRIDRGSTDTTDDLLRRRRPLLRAHLRRAARAGVEGLHRPGARPAVVGPARHHDHRRGDGRPARRQVALRQQRGRTATTSTFYGEYLEVTPPQRLQVDLHVRRRRRRPAGRPGDLHPRGDRRQDEGHLHRAHGVTRGHRGRRSRPAWSAAPSRRGIASRRCSPAADRPMTSPGTAITAGARLRCPLPKSG